MPTILARKLSSPFTTPLLIASRTRSQPPVCAAASPIAARSSRATTSQRSSMQRVRRDRPVLRLRGNDLVSEQAAEEAVAQEEVGGPSLLGDGAGVGHGRAGGGLARGGRPRGGWHARG